MTSKAVSATPEDHSEPEAPPKVVYLTRELVLNADDLATEDCEVPEWGGVVLVRALTGVERDKYESDIFAAGQAKTTKIVNGKVVQDAPEYNLQNLRAKLCSKTMIDADGQRLFSDRDVEILGTKSAAALDRVFSVAQRLSRLSKEDVKELTDQLSKDLSVASGSDSLES